MSVVTTGRPIKLIRQDLLEELYEKHTYGVPYTELVKRYDLPIIPITLKSRLKWYGDALTAPEEVRAMVFASLFPVWLTERVQSQKHTKYLYEGVMPIGRWILSTNDKREDINNDC